MRIVFMGTPEFAVPSLNALLHSPHQVVGVVTQPDRPKGRGQAMVAPPVKRVAQAQGLPLLQPERMKDPEVLRQLEQWRPDLIAVAAFGRILPQAILQLPPRGCVNVHASLLPRYRGAAPIQWALINGEQETGVTTMLMDQGMDTGDILLQQVVPIAPTDTAVELSHRLAQVGGDLLIQTLEGLETGTVVPKPQDHEQATLAPLLTKEDGRLDWSHSAIAIANRIRGLSPWPGCFTFLDGQRLMIWNVRIVPESASAHGEPAAPGTIVHVGKAEFTVTTGDGLLAVTEVQPANRKRMSAAEFVAGHRLIPGMHFRSTPFGGSFHGRSLIQSEGEQNHKKQGKISSGGESTHRRE
ncbi:MAG: methionyl-tRNA formyltransferase [Nitrospirae bacterium]|nr:MAG: methionyl-tRNA formyltransferase [Nitrospirota bacterium]